MLKRELPIVTAERRRMVFAAALGTVFEWYDFFLYGSMLLIIASKFFSTFPEQTREFWALLAFGAGFVIKPMGALLFGRMGDENGRKIPFMVTVMIMGASTFLIGLLPTAETIGVTAAVLLIMLRCLQGLALGGETNGALVFAAEYARPGQRGIYTSFVQLSAALGLMLALFVVLFLERVLGAEAFDAWGWRLPFLLSFILIGISLWLRARLRDSPAFLRMKVTADIPPAPLTETFTRWPNIRISLIALFGLAAGASVVTYTGLFFPKFFLVSALKVDEITALTLIAWSLVLGVGSFVLFGWLSDKWGRRPVILGGCLLAAATLFPTFYQISALANPALHRAQQTIPVEVVTDTATCSMLFNPTGTAAFAQPCEIAKLALGYRAVAYTVVHVPGRTDAEIRIGTAAPIAVGSPTFAVDLRRILIEAGYPNARNPSVIRMSHPFDLGQLRTLGLIALLTWLIILVAMVFAPIGIALAEMFPTRIRYTGIAVPYQISHGWFGGMLPAIVLAMSAMTGDVYFGLWYPVSIALATVVLGVFLVPETKDRDLNDDSIAKGRSLIGEAFHRLRGTRSDRVPARGEPY